MKNAVKRTKEKYNTNNTEKILRLVPQEKEEEEEEEVQKEEGAQL